jgi:outer membrane murein-binding lipoprotein Lpp
VKAKELPKHDKTIFPSRKIRWLLHTHLFVFEICRGEHPPNAQASVQNPLQNALTPGRSRQSLFRSVRGFMEFAIIIVFAVSTVAAAVCVGLLLGYYASQAKAPALRAEPNKFRFDSEALSMELENATASLSAAREENDNLTKRVADLTRHYLDQTDRMREVKQQRDEAQMHSRKLESEVARLRESASQYTPKVAAQVTQLAGSRTR